MCVDRVRPRQSSSKGRLLVLVWLASAAPAHAQSNVAPMDSIEDSQELSGELELNVGEQKVLSAEGVRSYSEGRKGVVDVRLTRDATRFVVVALEPGTTTLLFLLRDGSERHLHITVRDPRGSDASDLEPAQAVERRDNVRLDFYFVQLEQGYHHRIGLSTSDSVAVGAQASFDLVRGSLQGATAVVEDQALLRLDLACADGSAKLLRQASVLTRNGSKARFSGGGEVNIPVQGSLATGIHRISFGSSIEVLPRYDARSGRIEIALRADVSDLSDDRGTGTPGRTLSDLETVVNLRIGQAVILGGLSASSETHTRSGLPLLSQLPLLGVLFGSDRVTRQRTENVVLIVPSVTDPVPRDARVYLREALDAYRQYRGKEAELDDFADNRDRTLEENTRAPSRISKEPTSSVRSRRSLPARATSD